MHCALDLLARREHFQSELRTKLRQRGYDQSEIESAIDSAVEQGWQSEDRACESYVRSRMQKGFGPLKILSELQQRQASASLVQKWLPREESAWQTVVEAVGAKKYGLEPGQRLEPKRLRALLNRGFSHPLIASVYNLEF